LSSGIFGTASSGFSYYVNFFSRPGGVEIFIFYFLATLGAYIDSGMKIHVWHSKCSDVFQARIFERNKSPPYRGIHTGRIHTMKNIQTKVDAKGILTITVDLNKDFGPSASGKTIIVASTQGNQAVGTAKAGDVVQVGVNVYRKI